MGALVGGAMVTAGINPAGGGAPNILLRGTPTTGSAVNGGDITLSLPSGLVQNDVVVVAFGLAQAFGGGTSSAGWTQLGSTTDTGGSPGARTEMWRKVMGASPDSSIVLTGSADITLASSAIAIAFSGVDTTTPEDATPTSAIGAASLPDPPSVTPNTTGAVSIIFAAVPAVDITGTGAPAGYGDFTQVVGDDNKDVTSYLAWKSGLTGGTPEDPGTFTGTPIGLWAAWTVILKPA